MQQPEKQMNIKLKQNITYCISYDEVPAIDNTEEKNFLDELKCIIICE